MASLLTIPLPIRAMYFDLDGVVVNHPKPGHDRLDYQRLQFLRDRSMEYRHNYYREDAHASQLKHEAIWSSSDPFNLDSTDLSYVVSMMEQDFRPQNATPNLIRRAKDYIAEADRNFKTQELLLPADEHFEHDPNLTGFVRRLAKRYPFTPFFVNSGNSRFLAQRKIREIGLADVFMKGGALPDAPIYGEDILLRSDGIRYIQQNMLPAGDHGADVLFCDRPADPHALWDGGYTKDYYVYFNSAPEASSHKYHGSLLKGLMEAGRVLFVPPDMDSNRRIEILESTFGLERERLHPERIAAMNR